MEAPIDPHLFPYADHVLDRIEADAEVASNLRDAVRAGEGLVLDFHPHSGGGAEWCAAIRVESDGRDLVHLQGVVRTREDCGPMARALAGLIAVRHRLREPPRIVVGGAPLLS